ncbi:hypothetical protein [Kiloniella sp.]|uniref:hypothetical protein n=1 Tax=Kiloniella sp. TaxID=1938587 RepID=UPI003A8E096E
MLKSLIFIGLLVSSVGFHSIKGHANAQKPALKDLSQVCEADRYNQPIGEFSVDVYCDDTPIIGPYSLTQRTWQGGDWAFSITSFMWGNDRKSLYVATEGYNGTGKAYYLDIETQTSQEVWSTSPGDCGSVLTGMNDKNITLATIPCDGKQPRNIEITIPKN